MPFAVEIIAAVETSESTKSTHLLKDPPFIGQVLHETIIYSYSIMKLRIKVKFFFSRKKYLFIISTETFLLLSKIITDVVTSLKRNSYSPETFL